MATGIVEKVECTQGGTGNQWTTINGTKLRHVLGCADKGLVGWRRSDLPGAQCTVVEQRATGSPRERNKESRAASVALETVSESGQLGRASVDSTAPHGCVTH